MEDNIDTYMDIESKIEEENKKIMNHIIVHCCANNILYSDKENEPFMDWSVRDLIYQMNSQRFTTEDLCDTLIQTSSNSLPAHKCVLVARCSYFTALFTSKLEVKRNNNGKYLVDLSEFSQTSVELLLDVMYNVVDSDLDSYLRIDPKEFVQLLDFIGMRMLQNAVIEGIRNHMSLETCPRWYEFSIAYDLHPLPQLALAFVAAEFKEVVQSNYFKNFPLTFLKSFLNSDEAMCNSGSELIDGMIKWVYQDKTKRKEHLPTLVNFILHRQNYNPKRYGRYCQKSAVQDCKDTLKHLKMWQEDKLEECSEPSSGSDWCMLITKASLTNSDSNSYLFFSDEHFCNVSSMHNNVFSEKILNFPDRDDQDLDFHDLVKYIKYMEFENQLFLILPHFRRKALLVYRYAQRQKHLIIHGVIKLPAKNSDSDYYRISSIQRVTWNTYIISILLENKKQHVIRYNIKKNKVRSYQPILHKQDFYIVNSNKKVTEFIGASRRYLVNWKEETCTCLALSFPSKYRLPKSYSSHLVVCGEGTLYLFLEAANNINIFSFDEKEIGWKYYASTVLEEKHEFLRMFTFADACWGVFKQEFFRCCLIKFDFEQKNWSEDILTFDFFNLYERHDILCIPYNVLF